MRFVLYLSLVLTSVHATSADPWAITLAQCQARLGEVTRIVDGPLTASRWLTAGDDLARRVVRSGRPRYRRATNSVWLDFQRDPRFRGPPSSEKLALGSVLREYDWRYYQNNMRNIARRAGVGPADYFVTWENLGVRAINRLISRRIYPVGLVEKTMWVDGDQMTPEAFASHDAGHALDTESLVSSGMVGRWADPPSLDAITRFYQTFEYDRITASMDPRRHLLFDLGYFLYFHEGLGTQKWGGRFGNAAAGSRADRTKLLHFSYHQFETGFAIDINTRTRRTTVSNLAYWVIKRFLDRGDLYVNLPLEIKAAGAAQPDRIPVLVRGLLTEALTVFFDQHLAHAIDSLPRRQ